MRISGWKAGNLVFLVLGYSLILHLIVLVAGGLIVVGVAYTVLLPVGFLSLRTRKIRRLERRVAALGEQYEALRHEADLWEADAESLRAANDELAGDRDAAVADYTAASVELADVYRRLRATERAS